MDVSGKWSIDKRGSDMECLACDGVETSGASENYCRMYEVPRALV